ncbi:MAG: MarR family transcriptional regulator, partial [Chitinophagales bacterium]
YKNDGSTQQELSVFCRKDKSSTARIIAGLEQKKLLLRKTDRNDKRNKRVFLTKTAKGLQQKLLDQVDKTIQTVLKGQNEEDIETCKNVLRTVMINSNNALNLETTE